MKVVHFVGFRDDRYWSAAAVFGKPHFIHRGWDLRAKTEIAPGDTVVFANGDDSVEPNRHAYHDIDEAT